MATARSQQREGLTTVRVRPDLLAYSQHPDTDQAWVLKDPIRLRYFLFSEEEYWLIRQLDGSQTLGRIRTQFERVFSPIRLTKERLDRFVANLHRSGLMISDGAGQARVLLDRAADERKNSAIGFLSNPLAIRFPGLDPDRFLSWLYPKVRLCFGRVFAVLSLLLVVAAVGLLVLHADQLRQRLPNLTAFINAENLVLLAICLIGIKTLHELGHALTCKHYGGECHELGIMLLVFTPCLYCNVTDSWIIKNRWQRMAISAAGIGVELLLAALATFGWWYTRPGLANSICLNVMVVSGVSTILINANPLLRFDGYFLLSDLLNIPNLWQDAQAAGRRLVLWATLGISPAEIERPRREALLVCYALATWIYRIVLIVSILWMLYVALQPNRMEVIAYLLATIIVARSLVGSTKALVRAAKNPGTSRRLRPTRMLAALVVIGTLGYGVYYLPVPLRIDVPVVVEPLDAERVYVPATGLLTGAVAAGATVQQGDVLARLENPELEFQIAELHGEHRLAQVRLANLTSRAVEDDAVAAGILVAKEILKNAEQRLNQRLKELEEMTLRAPRDGVVLTPVIRERRKRDSNLLQQWAGTPIDADNVGCTLERGTLLCMIGEQKKFEAVLYVDEWDLEFVVPGQEVRLRLDGLPGRILGGTVQEVAQRNTEMVPAELVVGQMMPGKPDETGVVRPLNTSYQVRVGLNESCADLFIGSRGKARIVADSQPLGMRLRRFVRRTFAAQPAH